MKKILLIVLTVFLAIFLTLYFSRNIIAKSVFAKAVEVITGLKLSVSDINVGIFSSVIDVKELRLYNPEGFPDKLMLDLPLVYLNYDLGAFFENKIHLKSVKLYLREATVVKTADGKINIQVFEKLQPKEQRKSVEFMIDFLALRIDKVIYKDYFKKQTPQVIEFNVNIDEECRNIDDAKTLISLVTFKALMNTTIGNLAGFDIKKLKINSSKVLKEANKALDNVIDGAKGLGKTGKDVLGTFKDALGKFQGTEKD